MGDKREDHTHDVRALAQYVTIIVRTYFVLPISRYLSQATFGRCSVAVLQYHVEDICLICVTGLSLRAVRSSTTCEWSRIVANSSIQHRRGYWVVLASVDSCCRGSSGTYRCSVCISIDSMQTCWTWEKAFSVVASTIYTNVSCRMRVASMHQGDGAVWNMDRNYVPNLWTCPHVSMFSPASIRMQVCQYAPAVLGEVLFYDDKTIDV